MSAAEASESEPSEPTAVAGTNPGQKARDRPAIWPPPFRQLQRQTTPRDRTICPLHRCRRYRGLRPIFNRLELAFSKSVNRLQAVMNCASRLGREISEAEASAMLSSISPQRRKADPLAKYLGLTYQQRTILGITTIGACDFSKAQRKKQRKHKDRITKERKRREAGMRPQSESLSATEPWTAEGMSRATWYRRNKARRKGETTLSTAFFLSSTDRVVSVERVKGNSSGADAPKQERGYPSSQTASTMAADRYASLPLELRLAALCLPMPENLAHAA